MSAFSTFSGSSRKPRNVNLSGQPTNPWGGSGWSTSNTGSSKFVAQAQAEREKRHRERQELNAASRLQRVWRGHKVRQLVKQRRRQDYDALYSQSTPGDSPYRVQLAFPLLLALFDSSRQDDHRRLDLFTQDIASSCPISTLLDEFPANSTIVSRLAELLVKALEKRQISTSGPLLSLLVNILKRRPASIISMLDRYYTILTTYFAQNEHIVLSPDQHDLLVVAVSAPLTSGTANDAPNQQAYRVFAYSFLTSSQLTLLQQDPAHVAQHLDLEALSQSVIEAISAGYRASVSSNDELLWLLAHFIALNRSVPSSRSPSFFEALHIQLSLVANDIRIRSSTYDNEDEDDDDDDNTVDNSIEKKIREAGPLPQYVASQLEFLVNEDGISALLGRFMSAASTSARFAEDASLLAGHTLILLRCFPNYGDDIKIRLFEGDITTVDLPGPVSSPSVKYFWKAASRSEIFLAIQRDSAATAALLRAGVVRDREWRTILLFLELYNFLLRVTDDEDFLQPENQVLSQQSQATRRIRSSNLLLSELKQLIEFLKNLSFTLYHDLPDILSETSRETQHNLMFGGTVTSANNRDAAARSGPSSFAGIIGMDVLGLRETATTTLRSLYERDSRRPFLPKGFWLMPGKFDMKHFISAVVLEEQRKDAMRHDGDSSDSEGEERSSYHNANISRLSRAARIEQTRGMGSREKQAQLVPKLEILRNMPFIIPFDTRVQIFREFVNFDKLKRRGGNADPDRWRVWVLHGDSVFGNHSSNGREVLRRHSARVKRGDVFEDAFDQFYALGESLKEPIQITFVDQFNEPEAGIDGGGVTKEFLTTVTAEAFNPGPDGPGFFVPNKQNLLYPNPAAFDERAEALRYNGLKEGTAVWNNQMQEFAKRYEFLGRLVGKCMYEGILIDIAFASFFLLKWSSSGQSTPADYRANLNDLRDLDPELYQGLINLKNYDGNVADLSLDFTITDQFKTPNGGVRTVTRPLRKDGENIPVTNQDRPLYISYVARHRLVYQPFRQTKAFLRGLGSIIKPSWLSMFNQSELQRLVGGDSSEIDVEDLRSHTIYSGLYAVGDDGEEHPTVRMFWQVMHDFQDAERREVLKYVTSTPRAPLLGFAQLSPNFSIRDGGTDEERLPSTSTCINLLKLPLYKSPETLRSKLLYAIKSGAGFDLS